MKSSRFILSSDFATTKNDAEGTLTLALPDDIYVYANQPNRVFSAEIDLGSDKSAGVRTLLSTSTAQNKGAVLGPRFYLVYAIEESYGGEKNYGTAWAMGHIYRTGNKIRIAVAFSSFGSDSSTDYTKYYGKPQILTLRIQTFIDPFSV